jgi:fibronectin type 3 domain-containing protein
VNSIELAWRPNTEEDLAGYQVYRSVEGSAPERIAGPVDAPNFSDRTVEIGKKYSYTITAVDRTGNESAHSTAVEVTAQ